MGGAALATDEAFAEETVASSEVASDLLTTQDEVALQADSAAASVAVVEVETSTEVSQQSESKENAVEASLSASLSASESLSLSVSESVHASESVSASESLSESAVLSNSESLPGSEALSSQASKADQTSQSDLVQSENGSVEVLEGSKDREAGLAELTQVQSGAELLNQLAQEQVSDSSSVDLAAALATSQADLVAATAVLGNSSATLTEIQTAVSALKTSNQALVAELAKEGVDSRASFKLAVTAEKEVGTSALSSALRQATGTSGLSEPADLPGYGIDDLVPHENLPRDPNPGYYTEYVGRDESTGNYITVSKTKDLQNYYVSTFDSEQNLLTRESITFTSTNVQRVQDGFSLAYRILRGQAQLTITPAAENLVTEWIWESPTKTSTGPSIVFRPKATYVEQTTYFVDQSDNPLREEVVQKGWAKSAYTTTALEIPGYVLVEPDSGNGVLNPESDYNRLPAKL